MLRQGGACAREGGYPLAPPPPPKRTDNQHQVARSPTLGMELGDRTPWVPHHSNDPHDALIILNGGVSLVFISSGPISQAPTRRCGRGSICFCGFHPFLNSQRNSEYVEHRETYRHGVTKYSPLGRQKTFRHLWGQQFPPKSQIAQSQVRELWGVWRGGCLDSNSPPPRAHPSS